MLHAGPMVSHVGLVCFEVYQFLRRNWICYWNSVLNATNKAEEQHLWNWRVDQLPKREEELELQKLIHTPVLFPFNVKKESLSRFVQNSSELRSFWFPW